MTEHRKVAFIILSEVHILDLSGPIQVFYEAKTYHQIYDLQFASIQEKQKSSSGIFLAELVFFEQIKLQKGDYCFIPGLDQPSISTALFDQLEQVGFWDWLRAQHAKGVTICSVCNGAFILAKAGLLDGRRCTTHWKMTQLLAKQFPKTKVQEDCIYTEDRGVFTSAGVASGIDMSLAILEKNHGALFAAKVSHELVIYMRRNGLEPQKSVYLEYRNHVHNGVHRVQDWLVEHLDQKTTIEQLAALANMSARNLTRIFRKVTGISINEFQRLLRIEKAQQLLQQTNLTIEHIAQQCGFENPRQFRRIWKAEIGNLPSAFRKETIATNS